MDYLNVLDYDCFMLVGTDVRNYVCFAFDSCEHYDADFTGTTNIRIKVDTTKIDEGDATTEIFPFDLSIYYMITVPAAFATLSLGMSWQT